MGHLLTQVQFLHDSGLARDHVNNTWHFDSLLAPITEDDVEAIHEFVLDFYRLVNGASNIMGRMSSILTGDVVVRSYNMAAPEPREPIVETFYDGTVGASANESEVALCMSFMAVPLSGTNAARRRGRIYLGPFSKGANISASDTDPRPAQSFIDDILDSAESLHASVKALAWRWAVFSRMDNVLYEVDRGWVDNEWDTQRRRGLGASARTTVVFP